MNLTGNYGLLDKVKWNANILKNSRYDFQRELYKKNLMKACKHLRDNLK